VAVPTRAKSNTNYLVAADMARGSYVLLISLPEEHMITVGSLGPIRFSQGHYAYVGSALGGFRARLNRHLRTGKKPHWHIDYLLEKAVLDAIITEEARERTECKIARALAQKFGSVPGFGSSDCRCRSHLFSATEDMMTTTMFVLEATGLEPELKYVRGQG
jgi:sugar fermentation stimulation protein A